MSVKHSRSWEVHGWCQKLEFCISRAVCITWLQIVLGQKVTCPFSTDVTVTLFSFSVRWKILATVCQRFVHRCRMALLTSFHWIKIDLVWTYVFSGDLNLSQVLCYLAEPYWVLLDAWYIQGNDHSLTHYLLKVYNSPNFNLIDHHTLSLLPSLAPPMERAVV